MFIMSCDRCFSNIDYDENEVYHATGIKDGILNRHLHLCKRVLSDCDVSYSPRF